MVKRPGDLTPADVAPFVARPATSLDAAVHLRRRPQPFQMGAGDGAELRAPSASTCGRNRTPDVLLVYIEATDSTAHLFGHLFRAQGLAGELAAQQQRYGHAVEQMYVIRRPARRRVSCELMDDEHDAGRAVRPRLRARRVARRPEQDARHAAGERELPSPRGHPLPVRQRVRPRRRLDQPTLLDIAPTVLALTGVVAGARHARAGCSPRGSTSPTCRAWWRATRAARAVAGDGAATIARSTPPCSSACAPRLPRHAVAEGRPQPRRGALPGGQVTPRQRRRTKALVQENPDDAGAARQLGRRARRARAATTSRSRSSTASIEQEPLNPEAYHNRGVIYEKQGKRDAAIGEYRDGAALQPAVRSRRSRRWSRLTGGAQRRRAARRAEQRSRAQLAERGQPGGAARRLQGGHADARRGGEDRAALRAGLPVPRQRRLPHGRPRRAPRRRCKQALEIEPDNALFRTNLERLQQQKGASR